MSDRPTCVDCNAQAPETNTDETLVSSIGWRLERRKSAGGARGLLFLWRCPSCWRAFKEREKGPPKHQVAARLSRSAREPSHSAVICTVCGDDRLVKTKYRTPSGVTAPAWECESCLAILLHDSVAQSDDERDSVRLAKAARAAVIDEEPSPSLRSERPRSK